MARYCDGVSTADSFQQLLMLEAEHGAPSQYTPAINQLIEYYKQVISKVDILLDLLMFIISDTMV